MCRSISEGELFTGTWAADQWSYGSRTFSFFPVGLKPFPHQGGFCQQYSVRWRFWKQASWVPVPACHLPIAIPRVAIQPFRPSVSSSISSDFVTLFSRWGSALPTPTLPGTVGFAALVGITPQWQQTQGNHLHFSYPFHSWIWLNPRGKASSSAPTSERAVATACLGHHYPRLTWQDLFQALGGHSCLNDFGDDH